MLKRTDQQMCLGECRHSKSAGSASSAAPKVPSEQQTTPRLCLVCLQSVLEVFAQFHNKLLCALCHFAYSARSWAAVVSACFKFYSSSFLTDPFVASWTWYTNSCGCLMEVMNGPWEHTVTIAVESYPCQVEVQLLICKHINQITSINHSVNHWVSQASIFCMAQ